MKIVVINGSGGVGKDTFIDQLKNKGIKILNISTVDRIKEIANEIVPGCSIGKTERYRAFLSNLKDTFTEYNDLPFEDCKMKILNSNCDIAFVHCREPKEIQKFKERMGAKTLLIINPRIEHIVSNHADAEVYDYKYDFIINNSGSLKKLEKLAIEFYNKIKEG